MGHQAFAASVSSTHSGLAASASYGSGRSLGAAATSGCLQSRGLCDYGLIPQHAGEQHNMCHLQHPSPIAPFLATGIARA